MQLLPQARICNLRKKRSSPKVRQKRMDFEVDRQPVGNFALFPSVGRIFSYITGNLNADAADVINKNYNNIKHLAKASAKFAHMLNASLQIEIKHDNHTSRSDYCNGDCAWRQIAVGVMGCAHRMTGSLYLFMYK